MTCKICSDEFKTKNFGLKHDKPYLFVTPQCGPRVLYPLWTLFWLLWHVAVLIHQVALQTDSNDGPNWRWLKYLTNWSYVYLTISILVDLINTMTIHCCAKDRLKEDSDKPMPWYLKIHWILYTSSSVASLIVTISYYLSLAVVTIADMEESDISRNVLTFGGITHHAINSVYVVLLLSFSAKPFRLLHVYMPMLYLLAWSVFAIIYQHIADEVIYDVMDWFNPYVTIGVMAGIILVGVPIVHMLVFFFVQLRIWLSDKCCLKSRKVGPLTNETDGRTNYGYDSELDKF